MMQQIAEQKAVLRNHYLEARRALTPDGWARASNDILQQLLASDHYRESDPLATYVSAKDNEVDTWGIIDAALADAKGVLVPVVEPGNKQLRWARIQDRNELVRDRFGLLEPDPARRRFVDVPSRALCLVPGVAFTRTGQRIGYGGGYYDRFLATFSGISIGLAFEAQLAAALPTAPHDQPVQYVLTEAGWYPDAPS